jgi:hypothetical protein
VAGKDSPRPRSEGAGASNPKREAEELPEGSGVTRTPLFTAEHSLRYARQQLIREYEEAFEVNLIVVIDAIFARGTTYLEELIFDLDAAKPLHVLFASPGGDGETAIRMVRSLQARCSELTVLVPDQAKSAGTLLCLGADKILMGPAGDLGPVDTQFQLEKGLVGAKEIVAALEEADERVKVNPAAYGLFASLLTDVNMMMVEQARFALARCAAQVREALSSSGNHTDAELDALTKKLKAPLIDRPASHGAVISAADAKGFGLPAESFDPASDQWRRFWGLWTRYFAIGCWPAGNRYAAYEGRKASQLLGM